VPGLKHYLPTTKEQKNTSGFTLPEKSEVRTPDGSGQAFSGLPTRIT